MTDSAERMILEKLETIETKVTQMSEVLLGNGDIAKSVVQRLNTVEVKFNVQQELTKIHQADLARHKTAMLCAIIGSITATVIAIAGMFLS